MSFIITGTGRAVPERTVTNDELSTMMETSDEWISTRTGIRERRVLTHETLLGLTAAAGRAALENAGVSPDEIDLLLVTTLQGDCVSPSLCCLAAGELGLSRCTQMLDLNMACCGFLYALDVADSYFRAGKAAKALVISAEGMSRLLDWSDRSTCVLFGDGAGAAVLGKGDGLVASHLMTKGGDDVITIPTRYDRSPWYKNEISKITSVHMNGRETYKFAVMAMSDNIKDLMASAGVAGEDVALVIPHQANYRIINEARRRIPDIAPEKFCINIDRYGNTSSASVPILLDEMNRAGKIHEGDLIILAAFGGGLSAGAMIIRW